MNLPAFAFVALAVYFLVIAACIDFLEKMWRNFSLIINFFLYV